MVDMQILGDVSVPMEDAVLEAMGDADVCASPARAGATAHLAHDDVVE